MAWGEAKLNTYFNYSSHPPERVPINPPTTYSIASVLIEYIQQILQELTFFHAESLFSRSRQ
jgi:hypothetical protein